MRRLAATVLLGVLLLQAGAAPAPPSRAATAEAILTLGDANPQQVAKHLRTADVLRAIVQSPKARQLACLKREKNPETWLAARLDVGVDERRRALTIRVVGCHKNDALPLLSAVLEEVYQGHFCSVMLKVFKEEQQLLRDQAARGFIVDSQLKQLEIEIRALESQLKKSLLQPPRLVPNGR